jgi:general secretion pathway protein G
MDNKNKNNKRKQNFLKKLNKHLAFLKKRNPETGTTFVEVLVTISIIAILMTTITIAILPWIGKANETKAKQHIGTFKTAIQMYLAEYKKYPEQSEGLDVLKPYIQDSKIPKDPWGHEYVYMVPGPEGLDYGIISYGPNGVEDDDDITSWELDEEKEDEKI